MSFGRLHVLPERDTVDADRSQVAQGLLYFGVRLAETQHYGGLGYERRSPDARPLEHGERLSIAGSVVSYVPAMS